MRPKRPLRRRPASAAAACGCRRFCLTTNSLTPASRRRAPSPCPRPTWWPSAFRSARGGRRARPRSPAAGAGRWAWPARRSRRRLPASSAVSEAKPCAPRRRATAASSAAGSVVAHRHQLGAARRAGAAASMWFCAMRPQPTSAKRNLRSVIGQAHGMASVTWPRRAAWRRRTPRFQGPRSERQRLKFAANSTSRRMTTATRTTAAPPPTTNQLIAERREKLAAAARAGRRPSPTTSSPATTPPTCSSATADVPNEELEPQAITVSRGRPHDAQAGDGQGQLRHAAGRLVRQDRGPHPAVRHQRRGGRRRPTPPSSTGTWATSSAAKARCSAPRPASCRSRPRRCAC